MITVVHDLGARRTYNKIGVGEYAWQQHCYAIGDTKPRYPVPAIRLQVFIEPGLILVLQSTDPDAKALVFWN